MVNISDIFMCEYNYQLWMSSPDKTLETMIADAKMDERGKAGFFELFGVRSVAEITQAVYPSAYRALVAKVKARAK